LKSGIDLPGVLIRNVSILRVPTPIKMGGTKLIKYNQPTGKAIYVGYYNVIFKSLMLNPGDLIVVNFKIKEYSKTWID